WYKPIGPVHGHDDRTGGEERRRKFGVEENVYSLAATGAGNGELVPHSLVWRIDEMLLHIRVAGKSSRIGRIAVKEHVFIVVVEVQKLTNNVAGVDANAARLAYGARHNANTHHGPEARTSWPATCAFSTASGWATNQLPIARKCRLPCWKERRASAGVATIGSSCMLKLVLIRDGIAVNRW